jgi:hypothetical protein
MNREDMIRMLVEYSVAASAEDRQGSWVREIVTKGFRGFANMSSAELSRELRYRGLVRFEDPDEDVDFEDDGEEPGIEKLVDLHRSHSFEDAERG